MNFPIALLLFSAVLASSPPLLGTLHSFNENKHSLMSEYFHDDLDIPSRRRLLISLNEVGVSEVVEAVTGFTGGIVYEGLQYLVDRGTRWCTKGSDEQEFFNACRLNDLQKLGDLLKRNDMLAKIRNKNGETALMIACKDGFVEVVRVLLEAGADPNASNSLGHCPLIFASRAGKHNVLRALLGVGVDPNSSGIDGKTAAHWAALLGHISFLKYLLLSSVDLTLRDASGATALMLAASENRIQVLKVLLRYKGHLNLLDNVGETALHRAAYRNHLFSLQALLFSGADPTIANTEGLYPHQIVFGLRAKLCVSPAAKLLLMFFNLRIAMRSFGEQLCTDLVSEITLKVLLLSSTIY